MIHREALLQRHIRLYVRDAVEQPHQFMAFDRGRASGRFTHMRQKAMGVVAGCPDTLLIVPGICVWTELKAGAAKPSEPQAAIGRILHDLGHYWDWVNSVTAYHEWLDALSVPLRPGAAVAAMQHQAAYLDVVEKAENAAGKQAKPKRAVATGPRYLATAARGRRMIKGILP